MRTLTTLLMAAVLTGCAASKDPAIPDNSPASPTAAEAPATNVATVLVPGDAPTPPAIAADGHASHAHDAANPAVPASYTCPHHPEVVSDKPGMCPRCKMKLQAATAPAAPVHDSAAHADHAGHADTPGSKAAYTCPHHPEVVSDKPGMCPKCKMKLQAATTPASPVHDSAAHADHAGHADTPATKAAYTCPHHPEVVSDKPGTCPKCKMKLQAATAPPAAPSHDSATHADHADTPASKAAYTCPHHPEVISDKPGTCPKCNMKLTPATQPARSATHDHGSHGGGQ